MARMFRLKADLQEVAISAAYAQQKWKEASKKNDEEDDEEDDEELDGEGGVKKILLDEDGFWMPLVAALKASATAGNFPNSRRQPCSCRNPDSHQRSRSCCNPVAMADHGADRQAAPPHGRREAGDGQDLRPHVRPQGEDRGFGRL
eukprot:605321-Prymnesium_polylepis.1